MEGTLLDGLLAEVATELRTREGLSIPLDGEEESIGLLGDEGQMGPRRGDDRALPAGPVRGENNWLLSDNALFD